MTRLISRRPRPAFAHPPLPTLTRPKPLFLCKASASPSPSDNVQSTTRVDQVRTKMESTRHRVHLLNTRVIVRAAEAGIQAGQAFLVPSSDTDHPSSATADTEIIDRLRRDLKNLRRIAKEQAVDTATTDVILRLQAVAAAVEETMNHRHSQNLNVSDTYARELLEDELEGAAGIIDDLQWLGDTFEAETRKDPADKDLVDSVRRQMVETSNELRRRASNVGAGIEEKIGTFVNSDGSINVNGVRTYVGSVVDNASMTWQRLNGIVPTEEANKSENAVEVESANLEVRDKEKEYWLREEIGKLEKQLIAGSRQREAVLRNEDQLGKLIRAREIRQMDDEVSVWRRTLAVRVLQLEMENIFVSLAEEIENSDYEIMMDQRVLVAEFGDLDGRLATLELFVDEDEPLLIEDDALGELAADIQDLKTRLGIDEPLYSSATLNWVQLRQFFISSARKTRAGAEFYSRGLRLFAGDVRFAMRLIRRAITGYTPSPREIRTLRRTGKDLLTLIPFTVVLVAPLTPVGHVLIFSFLQRYWPEFFPSTFSERRQAVMKKHEEYQKLMQQETDEKENGLENGVGTAEASPKTRDGPLAAFRRLLFFGVVGNEAAELTNSSRGLSGERMDNGGPAPAASTSMDESPLNGSHREDDLHPLALNDIASSVRDNGTIGKIEKKPLALDEVHLAD